MSAESKNPCSCASGELPEIIITIDGPAGTGKSSVSRMLAKQLGLEFLDTGAMYRAVAAIALDKGIPLDDGEQIASAALQADLHFDWKKDPPSLMASWTPIDDRLRDADVNAAVSPVASLPEVRDVLVRRQRIVGQQHPRLVTEGRDQGSIVFPQAKVKFYLDATPEVRAVRRVEQLRSMGIQADAASVRAEIEGRDERDTSRAVGPLICPQDAIKIDTSEMSFDDVVNTLEKLVRDRLGNAVPSPRCSL